MQHSSPAAVSPGQLYANSSFLAKKNTTFDQSVRITYHNSSRFKTIGNLSEKNFVMLTKAAFI